MMENGDSLMFENRLLILTAVFFLVVLTKRTHPQNVQFQSYIRRHTDRCPQTPNAIVAITDPSMIQCRKFRHQVGRPEIFGRTLRGLRWLS